MPDISSIGAKKTAQIAKQAMETITTKTTASKFDLKLQEVQKSQQPEELQKTQTMQQSIRKVIDEVNKGQLRLEELINYLTSGREFKLQELLTIQVEVYKLTQELEIFSKAVDHSTSGIKQTMQIQA